MRNVSEIQMVLQLCYTFYCLVRHTDTREVILVSDVTHHPAAAVYTHSHSVWVMC
jgi:hypothetical protein